MAASNQGSNGYEDHRIPLDQLIISESNVRKREITADLDQLAYSMATFGLQQPIVVQRRGDRFEILIGQRRYLAAKRLGWDLIPARVREAPVDELEAKVVSFSENVQRRDLSPRDKADTCSYLLKQLGSVTSVARHLGITDQTVRKWLGYQAVPEGLKQLVEQNAITRPFAVRLAEFVDDEDKAVAIAKEVAQRRFGKDERDRVLEAVEELPDRAPAVILDRAERLKYSKEIRFVLPERWSTAIDAAGGTLGKDPADIAKDATIEWLQANQF